MSRVVSVANTPHILEREIKLCLSSIHRIYQSLQTDNSSSINSSIENSKKREHVPYWLGKYNNLSLLSLLETMKEYGSLFNLWEGSNQDKGYIRYAKPMIVNIHSKNWRVGAILKLKNEKSLDAIIDYYIHNGCKDENVKNCYVSIKRDRVRKMYVTYKTIN